MTVSTPKPLVKRETSEYEKGYNSGYIAGMRKSHPLPNKKRVKPEILGYGMTRGNMEVIQMWAIRFKEPFNQIARYFHITRNAVHQIVETKQFADLIPEKGKGWNL